MNLETIAQTLNNDINVAVKTIKVQRNLGDVISLRLSLDKEENWASGIFHNSRYLIAMVFCNTVDNKETDNCKYTFEVASNRTGIKIQNKNKPSTGEEILKHLKNQLTKLI